MNSMAGGDDRPSVYKEGEDWIIRASALGSCIRELVSVRNGERLLPWSDKMEEIFAAGHAGEGRVLERVEEKWGRQVVGRQDEATLLIRSPNGNIWIRGHIDGKMKGYVVEAKLFGESTFELIQRKGLAAFPRYEWQLSCYMFGLNMGGLFVVGQRDDPLAHYEEIVMTPPRSLDEIEQRALAIIDAVSLPDCDVNQFPCRVATCPSKQPVRTPIANEELVELCRQDVLWGKNLRDVKEEREKVREQIQALLPEGVSHLQAGDYLITNTTSVRRTLLDKKLREALPPTINLDDYYKETPTTTLRVTEQRSFPDAAQSTDDPRRPASS